MMIPIWYSLLIGLWLLVIAGVVGILAFLVLKASYQKFGRPTGITIRAWVAAHTLRAVVSAITALLLTAVLGCLGYFFTDTSDIPDMTEMVRYAPPQIGYIYHSHGEVMIELAQVFRKPLTYSELGLPIEQATIASEDKDFYEHDGIPILCSTIPVLEEKACVHLPIELFWRWMLGKGGSTITMQLVRNHYLGDMLALERTNILVVNNRITRTLANLKGVPWVNRRIRKMREIKYAFHLERLLTDYAQRQISAEMQARGFWWPQRWVQSHTQAKRRAKEIILARYLSTVYYGYSMYGPDSASRFYFNRPVRDLSIDEAALLASFEPAPSTYGNLLPIPAVRSAQVARRNAILQRMGNAGFIYTNLDCGRPSTLWDSVRWFFRAELPRGVCRDDVAFYGAKPIRFTGKLPGSRTNAPAAVQTALDEIVAHGFPFRKLLDGKIRLHTTNDIHIQNVVNRAAEEGLRNYRQLYSAQTESPQIAIVVLRNSDAALLGQFGGFILDKRNAWTHLDRSRKSWRQPGSVFKVFVYLAALADGAFTPDSLVNDGSPYPIRMGGGWIHYVRNYTNDYRGWMPFREALAQSRNVPAMHVGIEYTSLSRIIEVAREAGITSELRNEASTILGASEISVIELANAFRTIASGGIVAKPYALERITNSFGEDLNTHYGSVRRIDLNDQAVIAIQELLRGAVRLPSGTARSMQALLPEVPLMCKTGTSNNFADARATCSTYGPTGVTVSVWVGFDGSLRSLGEGAAGGRIALPIARFIFDRFYRDDTARGTQAILGTPPQFPEDMEERITSYIDRKYPKLPAKK